MVTSAGTKRSPRTLFSLNASTSLSSHRMERSLERKTRSMTRDQLVSRLRRAGELEVSGEDQAETGVIPPAGVIESFAQALPAEEVKEDNEFPAPLQDFECVLDTLGGCKGCIPLTFWCVPYFFVRSCHSVM